MKKVKHELPGLIGLIIIITLFLLFPCGWSKRDLSIPVQYQGGDDFSMMADARKLIDGDWNTQTDRLGTPYGSETYDFTANALHNVDLVIMKVFTFFSNDPGTVSNLSFLSIFYLCGIVSYFVMRELKIRRWASVGGSLVFSMCSYIFTRNMGHFVLACCYFVPLSVLLCLWVYIRDDYMVFGKGFFKNPRNWFTILFALLIANNGIVYYPFFTCFLLVATGISKSIKERNAKYFLRAGTVILEILMFMVIALIPTLIYLIKSGGNSSAVVRVGFAEADIYALRIAQMFVPVNSHDIGILERIIEWYKENTLYYNENSTSYIGIMGGCGFLFLLVSLFVRTKNAFWNKIRALSELNIACIFMGIAGGLGTIVAFFVTDKIRGYCRISVFIFYISVLAFVFLVNHIYSEHKKPVVRLIMIMVFSVISLITVFDQIPGDYIDDIEKIEIEYTSDKTFVKSIEDSVPEGSMIYQLPYHDYPEAGPVEDMMDYHLFIGFIHSKTLKWSYGSMKGSTTNVWNEETGSLDIQRMIESLRTDDFAGVYVDRRAYLEDDLAQLEKELSMYTNDKGTVSTNGNLSFYKL